MNCPRCNTPLATGSRFCGVCGNVLPPGNMAILSGDENATLLDSWENISGAPGQTAPVSAPMQQNAGSTLPDLPGALNEPAGRYMGANQAQAGTFQAMPQPTQPAPAWPQTQPPQGASWPQAAQPQGVAGFPPTLPQGPVRQAQPAPTWP